MTSILTTVKLTWLSIWTHLPQRLRGNRVVGRVLLAVMAIGLFTGCNSLGGPTAPCERTDGLDTMTAVRADAGLTIDGQLDEAVWQDAPIYTLSLSRDEMSSGKQLEEGAQAQLAWDDEWLYVGVQFTDSDVRAEKDEDHVHHYQFGDVCEVFLKPACSQHYWELYDTPLGRKTVFFFTVRGAEITVDRDFDLTVASTVQGTLNEHADRDQGWTAELAVPIKDLTQYGDAFKPGLENWRILVARYNYSDHLEKGDLELTMAPQLSRTSYHLVEEYAILKLEKKPLELDLWPFGKDKVDDDAKED